MTFNLNLSHHVIAKAEANPKGFIDYVHRRISRRLDAALGRPTDFWFVVEKTKKGLPHLHGALVVDQVHYKQIRLALRKAGGKWDKKKQRAYQLRMQKIFYADGWVDYAMKGKSHLPLNVRTLGIGTTNSLKAAAKRSYEEARQAVRDITTKRSRTSSHTPSVDEGGGEVQRLVML